jgi:octaprenyl-diphosphate synthase
MLDQICIPIKSQLEEIEAVITKHVVSSVPLATEVSRYTTEGGGKRVRPAVFLLSARLCGAPGSSLPEIAAAVELVHTASLLHDDVVDDALMRRGKQSARAKWGNQISVLVGDFLWCCSSSLLLEHAPDRLYQIVSRAVTDTTEGELLEITRQNDSALDREIYLNIIASKTAALFAASAQSGAVVAGMPRDFEMSLKDYGFNLGMAFQLTDDVLDYTCGEKTLGKTPGADLKEGKLTLPLIAALESASMEEVRLIRSAIIGGNLSEGQLVEIFSVVKERGGITTTMNLARSYAEKAKSHLSTFKPSIEREALASLADYVVERNE